MSPEEEKLIFTDVAYKDMPSVVIPLETSLDFQFRISMNLPKPDGLSVEEENVWANLKEQMLEAVKAGYTVAVPAE